MGFGLSVPKSSSVVRGAGQETRSDTVITDGTLKSGCRQVLGEPTIGGLLSKEGTRLLLSDGAQSPISCPG